MLPTHASDPLDAAFRDAIGAELASFVQDQRSRYGELAEAVPEVFDLALDFTSGGKRIRPGFCYWSFVASTRVAPAAAVVRAAASLDLLHVSALLHDDVMDASDTRRGIPAAHRQFERRHSSGSGQGDPAAFGRAGAILLGDLLITLSAEMFDTSGLPQDALRRALPHVHAMRTEVALGQFLDVRSQALPSDSLASQLADAVTVTEYKTASYSVRRPCQIGGAIAGADDALVGALADFGSPLGRAFQLRDDLLGIFGDPQVTGKPAGDDLREGKRTVVLALALNQASGADAAILSSLVGADLTEQQLDTARTIIVSSGARDAAEARIASEFDQAMAALDRAEITVDGRIALTRLAEMSVHRDA